MSSRLSSSGGCNTHPPPSHHGPLFTREIWWLLIFFLVANASLALLFAVLPLFAEMTAGLALAAGLATGVMMLVTVVVELGTPRLMAALGYRRAMDIGIALMGVPARVLIAVPSMSAVLIVSAARGAELAISLVAGTALAANLYPPHGEPRGSASTAWPSVSQPSCGIRASRVPHGRDRTLRAGCLHNRGSVGSREAW